MSRRRIIFGAAMGTALCLLPGMISHAEDAFPTRPITIVVPWPAGGNADFVCRSAANKIAPSLATQVIVENRPGGAGGRVGMEQVLRAAPDGSTLLCTTVLAYSITHLVFSRVSFDPRQLEPISVLTSYPIIIAARKDFPADNLKELIGYAKANPGKVTYGHAGKANTGHLFGELLMRTADFKMIEVPYRGSAPALNDVLAGNIDIMVDFMLAAKANIDAGRIKLIAVADRTRLKEYPDVQAVNETLPGVTAPDTWIGVAAPPGTPKAITAKISESIQEAFKDPELRERILKLQAKPLGTPPDEMRKMIREATETWEPVIKAANISIE